jgi:hypothetical protein
VVPVSLPRGRLTLTLLPRPQARRKIRDFVTRLDATLDVGALPPGNYELASRFADVRRTGGWIPVEIR